jgi:outer membrane protein assembly factor BamB
VRWQVPLARAGGSVNLAPLAVGAVAVFAQNDVLSQGRPLLGVVLYGLRLADGHRLWSRAFSQGIAAMWRWRHLVVVLTPGSGQQQQPVLTGLDASTGQARWTLRVGESVRLDGFSQTADGGLALAAVDREDGAVELEVVDLSSGRVRWTRPVDSGAVPLVAVRGGAVLFFGGAYGDANSSLTSYDDRTGQVRWTEALKPMIDTQALLQASARLVYLTAEVRQAAGGQPTWVLLGISGADGSVKWRFTPRRQPESLDVYAPGLISVGTSLDELDPATGRVRWHVVSPEQAIATPAGIIVTAPGPASGPAVGTYQIGARHTLTGRTRWTAELTEPLASAPWQPSPVPSVFLAGRLLVAPTASPDDTELLAAFRISDGHRAWQVTLPGLVEAPVSAAPGGMLVYAGG